MNAVYNCRVLMDKVFNYSDENNKPIIPDSWTLKIMDEAGKTRVIYMDGGNTNEVKLPFGSLQRGQEYAYSLFATCGDVEYLALRGKIDGVSPSDPEYLMEQYEALQKRYDWLTELLDDREAKLKRIPLVIRDLFGAG